MTTATIDYAASWAPAPSPAQGRAGRRTPDDSDLIDQLGAEVARLEEENRRAAEEIASLREAVAARDVFLAAAARELRNAMGGVLVAATHLRFRVNKSAGLPPWVLERVELISRQARGFVRRATTLLDVARLLSGALNLAPVAWTDVLMSVLEELQPEAERSGCRIEIAGEESVVGLWDREALEQITGSLVLHAIQSGAGAPVCVGLACEADGAVLRVSDRGAGIGEAERAKMFERFERVVPSGNAPALGMGLWIARQLALAHGGDIEVTALPGAGSLFSARLPRVYRETEHVESRGVSAET
jgi:signal transduction histidine kinase